MMEPEWITPAEAERVVGNSLGTRALLTGGTRHRLSVWIERGKIRMRAFEVERWEDEPLPPPAPPKPGVDPLLEAIKEGVLNAWELPLTCTVIEDYDITFADLAAAAGAGCSWHTFWSAGEIEHTLAGQRNPSAKIVYSGIRLARADIVRRLEIDGFSAIQQADHQPCPFTYDEVVAWCEAWIASGAAGSQNAAWDAFKVLPRRANRSRDDLFRPAWNEAKGKKPK